MEKFRLLIKVSIWNEVILESNNITAYEFTWFDTGNLEAIKITREAYAEPNAPNILEKENEAIWFIENNVVKFSD